MPTYVQVGKDVIEFPDGMSDEQIAQAISGTMPQAKAPSSGFMMGLKGCSIGLLACLGSKGSDPYSRSR